MTSRIQKSTPRGQITLPKKWRDRLGTDTYVLELYPNKLIIVPFQLDKAMKEEILFDADRDNNGRGISSKEMIRLIHKINNE